jgi:hypothetical protein
MASEPERLDRWVTVAVRDTGGLQATCALCHWSGVPCLTVAGARQSGRAHARGRGHREDAEAHARSEREERAAVLAVPPGSVAARAKVTLESRIVHAPRCTLDQVIGALFEDRVDRQGGYSIRDRWLIAWLIHDIATVVGVDPLIVVAQLVHETTDPKVGAPLTAWWAQRPRRNPAGIGVTGEKDPKTGEPLGVHFPGWSWAVRAHVGRLLLYAGGRWDSGVTADRVAALRTDARAVRPFPPAKFGKGATVGTLAKAGWATDPDYAHKLVTVANRIAAR